MKLTPTATTAIDLIVQTVATFRRELSSVVSACDVLIDAMTAIKDGEITPDLVDRLTEARRTLEGLPSAVKAMAIIVEPACDIISREMDV